jgi:HIP---CoA ligase
MAETDPRGDLEWGTTSHLLTKTAARLPAVDALIDGDVTFTYPQLDEAVTEVARSVMALGVEPGDRVAVWGPNSARWVLAALGLQRAGAVLVPLNTRFVGDEAQYVLDKAQVRLLFTVSDFLGRDYPASLPDRGSLGQLTTIVVMSGATSEGCRSWAEFIHAGEAVTAASVEARAAAIGPDDLSDVLFTSGTTGRPKGAMCTHGQTLRAYAVWSQVVGLREGDRYLIVNPFFHGFGYKAGWLASIMMGATIVPAKTLDVPLVLQAVREHNITVLPGTPTLYQTMLEHPAFTADGIASLRLSVLGAANIPPTLLYRIKEAMGFDDIVTGYGLTESTAIVSMCRYDDPLETVATSCGRPLPGLEVQIVDPGGNELPTGAAGEIVVRGYTVMRGYLDEPGETAATIDTAGWLHTGDIGIQDADGMLHITDRIKDMFIVGGFNAYPAEIEHILNRHDAIAQVAVIGVPDERMGEVGAAFVIPRANHTITPEEVIAYSREHMANYKVPRQVHIVGSLPMNASGKVLKGELRTMIGG